MLNEGTETPPSPLQSTPQVRQHLPPAQQSDPSQFAGALQTQMLSRNRSRLRLIYLGTAATLICTLAAFFALFHGTNSAVPRTRATVGPVAAAPAQVPAQTSASRVAAPVAPPPTEGAKQQEPAPEPVQFRLKRSKAFEKIGPIRLRLVKANPKRDVCDLYLTSGGPAYQKQVHLNKPVQIDLPDGAGSAELVMTSIKADQVSGSVQQK
jgi:hypothetical protein